MKFIASSAVLQKQLAAISGAVPSNPVIPILENFLFELKDGVLIASATDLNVSMTTRISVESQEEASITIPAKILLDTLKSLPEQPVTIEIDAEKYILEITANSGNYKLSGENAEDFPKIPQPEDPNATLMFTSNVLQYALGKTLFAVGNDEMRPAMSGVLMQSFDDNFVFVSTDSHRLIQVTRNDIKIGEQVEVIVPKKALTLLKSILPTDEAQVETAFDSTNAFFNFGNINMVARLIDENYPDYKNAIPNDNPNVLTVNRVDMLGSLRRLVIYANKTTKQVRMKIEGARLQIFAEDLDYSNEAKEMILCEFEGEEMEIGFNAGFLIDVFSNLDSEEVTLSLSTPNRACIIRPKETIEDEDILMLVMPVMLSSYA